MLDARRSAVAGVGAVAASLVAVLVAPTVAPWFSWGTNALSDLGTSAGPERLLFTYGLVVAGVVGVGRFPAGTPLHLPAAFAAYLGFLLAPVLYGVGELRAGRRRAGLACLLDGSLHLGVWFPLTFVYLGVAFGLAVPELVGALLFDAWMLGVATRILR